MSEELPCPHSAGAAAPLVRVATWNCAGGFASKIDRALELDADVYVIQEAEPFEAYAHLLPQGMGHYYEKRPEYPKGLLVLARAGWAVIGWPTTNSAYAHVAPVVIVAPNGVTLDLRAVWTLDAAPRELAYVGQMHLALDDVPHLPVNGFRAGRIAIGDFNSNAIWDHERQRNHATLVARFAAWGMASAYHSFTGEIQGEEKQPTFYLQRNELKPFHIDHCFTDLEIADVRVGSFSEWSGLKASGGVSDHCPMVVALKPRDAEVARADGLPVSMIESLVASTEWKSEVWGASPRERFDQELTAIAFIATAIVGSTPSHAAQWVASIGQNMGGGLPFPVYDRMRTLVNAAIGSADVAEV